MCQLPADNGRPDPGAGQLLPVGAHGSVRDVSRPAIIAAFQQLSLEHRLLIGIDLDDKHGRFPRRMFVMPSYSAMNAHKVDGTRVSRHRAARDDGLEQEGGGHEGDERWSGRGRGAVPRRLPVALATGFMA